MTEDATPERRKDVGAVERHLQTILISVITGAIFFSANFIYNDNRTKAVQQTQLEVLTSQVIELRADVRGLRDNYASRADLEKVEDRLRIVERAMK